MRRLIDRGLMFGNMVAVDNPVWVARYNRALKRLTGRESSLSDFYIDISGFSPEVALDLEDPLYLNPHGVNRQFILLTPDQKHAPLLDAKFSFSRVVLRDFIDVNEAQLFALTARDGVAGEMDNAVIDLSHPRNLTQIKRIGIEADTTEDALLKASVLSEKVDEFFNRPDGWHDDVLIAQMINLAQTTGDVTRNPIALKRTDVQVDSFWTSHFGGAFFLRYSGDLVIVANDPSQFPDMGKTRVIGMSDHGEIASYLFQHDLVEAVLPKRGAARAFIVQDKMDMIVAYAAAMRGHSPIPQDSRDLRRLGRQMAHDLPRAYTGLAGLLRWATQGGEWPRITTDDPAYFYSLRSKPGDHAGLVNRLIAALTPMDMRQLFICHKEAFYSAYARWPDPLRSYIAELLADEYMSDKPSLRATLFGPTGDTSQDDIAARVKAVGPWGALKGRR